MSQEMFLRKIPEDMRPWECNVNGVKYVYPAGTEQNVPAEVAALIDAYWEKQEVDYPETGISFNDLRDRPFGESTEVLFDQRVEFMDADGMLMNSTEFPDMFEVGKTYTVTYNGTVYKCVAIDPTGEGVGYIGNAIVFGGEYTGEPFVMAAINKAVKGYIELVSMPLNGDTSATIKIEKSVIHTIDPKFLPGKVVYYWDSDTNTVTDANGNEITVEQAAKDMFNVVIRDLRHDDVFQIPIRITSGDGYVRFDWYSYDGGENVVIGEQPR